jgi:hypothetical protein
MRKGMMKMTTMLKSREAAADGIFTEAVWKILHPDAGGSALKGRAAVSVDAGQRLVEKGRSQMNLHDPTRFTPLGDFGLWVVMSVIALAYLFT